RLQDRVRPAQLVHFFLQLSEPLGVAGRGPGPVALVDLGLHNPVPQSLGIDPELLAHTAERTRPRRWIPPRVHGHPRGPLPKLIGVLPRCCHAPHPPVDSEPPPDPGRFTTLLFSRRQTPMLHALCSARNSALSASISARLSSSVPRAGSPRRARPHARHG